MDTVSDVQQEETRDSSITSGKLANPRARLQKAHIIYVMIHLCWGLTSLHAIISFLAGRTGMDGRFATRMHFSFKLNGIDSEV